MAADGTTDANGSTIPSGIAFKSTDFGLDQADLQEMTYGDDDVSSGEEEMDDELDPIEAERKRRAKKQDHLRRSAGEPVKPEVSEVWKLQESFLVMLRMVLSE